MGNLRIKGYFTIEAALIMPTVIGVTIFLIYISFYYYDRCVLEQTIMYSYIRKVDVSMEYLWNLHESSMEIDNMEIETLDKVMILRLYQKTIGKESEDKS